MPVHVVGNQNRSVETNYLRGFSPNDYASAGIFWKYWMQCSVLQKTVTNEARIGPSRWTRKECNCSWWQKTSIYPQSCFTAALSPPLWQKVQRTFLVPSSKTGVSSQVRCLLGGLFSPLRSSELYGMLSTSRAWRAVPEYTKKLIGKSSREKGLTFSWIAAQCWVAEVIQLTGKMMLEENFLPWRRDVETCQWGPITACSVSRRDGLCSEKEGAPALRYGWSSPTLRWLLVFQQHCQRLDMVPRISKTDAFTVSKNVPGSWDFHCQ